MHENGYRMHNGIHHLTLGAVVTTPHGGQAHAVVHVSEAVVEVEGFGVLFPLSTSISLTKEMIKMCFTSFLSVLCIIPLPLHLPSLSSSYMLLFLSLLATLQFFLLRYIQRDHSELREYLIIIIFIIFIELGSIEYLGKLRLSTGEG